MVYFLNRSFKIEETKIWSWLLLLLLLFLEQWEEKLMEKKGGGPYRPKHNMFSVKHGTGMVVYDCERSWVTGVYWSCDFW